MFASLQEKFDKTLRKLKGGGTVTKADLDAALRDVKMSLLEADVNFQVVKDFCARIAEKSQGEEILKSLSAGQQIVKIVHEELINTMGSSVTDLNINVAPPAIIMMVGLQGSGKTTTSGKLANLLKKDRKRKPLLVPADVYRPAAIDQLNKLGSSLGIPVFNSNVQQNPVDIAKLALEYAKNHLFDTIIIDTAGRLQIDSTLMEELANIVDAVNPHEILLVVDAMTGQEAVNVAKGFDAVLDIDGLILTKLDGDARGGGALSMKAVTGKPIKFVGVGEKMDALEPFHPERMASRILGMGDVLTLIEKATKEVSVEESMELHSKMKKNQFSFEDFLSQMKMMKRMGSISSIASMIPGLGKMATQIDSEKAEKEMKKIEAIILSMTTHERKNPDIINGSRRKRIASGSGTSVQDVNTLLKQFLEMKKFMHQMTKGGIGNLMKMFGGKGLPGMMGR